MNSIDIGNNSVCQFINRKQLIAIKTKAIRSGVWFRSLRRIDRVLIELTIIVAKTVRSPKLARSVLELINKINSVIESRFSSTLYKIGFSLADHYSQIAQKLGNNSAKHWATDVSYAFFLAIMHVNNGKINKET